MFEAWYEEVAEIGAKANAWLDFSITCGWIGLGLSLIALVLLILKIRKERGGAHNKTDLH